MSEDDVPPWFKVGVSMHTSCNDEYWGPVTRIGPDANGRLVCDFEFASTLLEEFIDTQSEDGEPIRLTQIETPDAVFKMVDCPIESFSTLGEDTDDPALFVYLATPGNNCAGCSKRFRVRINGYP